MSTSIAMSSAKSGRASCRGGSAAVCAAARPRVEEHIEPLRQARWPSALARKVFRTPTARGCRRCGRLRRSAASTAPGRRACRSAPSQSCPSARPACPGRGWRPRRGGARAVLLRRSISSTSRTSSTSSKGVFVLLRQRDPLRERGKDAAKAELLHRRHELRCERARLHRAPPPFGRGVVKWSAARAKRPGRRPTFPVASAPASYQRARLSMRSMRGTS
jgi:hypothetical protein